MSRLNFITANRSGVVRRKTLNGRKYTVAPVVMIRQGVLPGSNGKILYTNAAVNRRIDRWNGMPLTLGHPEDEAGAKISARSPDIVDKFQIGTVYNTAFSGDKLKAEAWFDEVATEKASPGLLAKVRSGEKIELSTGLFTNVAAKTGQKDGKDYTHELKSYEPDHLAVLLNEKGACSLTDGCGVNTNSASPDDVDDASEAPLTVIAVNSLSHSDISAALQRLLFEKYKDEPMDGSESSMEGDYPRPIYKGRVYLQDVYPDHVIFECGGYNDRKTYRQDYKLDGSTISLTGDKVEVVLSRIHKTVKTPKKGSMTFASNAGNYSETSMTFGFVANAGSCGAGGGKGKPGFQSKNSCAKGSGRAGFGAAKTATPAQKKAAKKRAEGKSSGAAKPAAKSGAAPAKKSGLSPERQAQLKRSAEALAKRQNKLLEEAGATGAVKKAQKKVAGGKSSTSDKSSGSTPKRTGGDKEWNAAAAKTDKTAVSTIKKLVPGAEIEGLGGDHSSEARLGASTSKSPKEVATGLRSQGFKKLKGPKGEPHTGSYRHPDGREVAVLGRKIDGHLAPYFGLKGEKQFGSSQPKDVYNGKRTNLFMIYQSPRPTGNRLDSFTANARRSPLRGLQLTTNCGDTPCGPCAAKAKRKKLQTNTKIRSVDDLFTPIG